MSNTSAVKTILFVENDPVSLAMYQNRLQREGFYVKTAQDGLGALKALAGQAPDIVVLDLMLPRFSGSEVFKFIRTDPRLRNLPVVIFSNAAMSEWPQDVAVGATQCLLKSDCTFPTLLQTITDLLAAVAAGAIPALKTDTSSTAKPQPAPAAVVINPPVSVLKPAAPAVSAEQPQITGKADFIRVTLAEIPKLREYCLAYIKAPASEMGKQHGVRLNERIQALSQTSSEFGCTQVAQLTKAFATLLGEITIKSSWMTPSVLQTIAQAVDCLNFLLEHASDNIPESTTRPKVLAVDDDPICNRVMVTTLKRANFDISSIESPLSALQLLQANRYDVILLDVNMPDLTGFELCNKLRQLSHCKTTPVVFITAFNNFENRKQSVLSGGDDFITKPVSPLELALKVTIHLLKARVQRGNAPLIEPEPQPQSSEQASPSLPPPIPVADTAQVTNSAAANSSSHTLVIATTESGTTGSSDRDSRQTPPPLPVQPQVEVTEEVLEPAPANRISFPAAPAPLSISNLPASTDSSGTSAESVTTWQPQENAFAQAPAPAVLQPVEQSAFAGAIEAQNTGAPSADSVSVEEVQPSPDSPAVEPFAVAISSLAPGTPTELEQGEPIEIRQIESSVPPAIQFQPSYDPLPEGFVLYEGAPAAAESTTRTDNDSVPDFTPAEEIAINSAPGATPFAIPAQQQTETPESQHGALAGTENFNSQPVVHSDPEPFGAVIIQGTSGSAAPIERSNGSEPTEPFVAVPVGDVPASNDPNLATPGSSFDEPFATSITSTELAPATPAPAENPARTKANAPSQSDAEKFSSEPLTIFFPPKATQSRVDEPVVFHPEPAQSAHSAQSQQPAPAQSEKASTSESESSKAASRDRAPRQSAPWTENEFPPVFVSDQAPSTASTQFEKPPAQQEPAYTDLRPTDVPTSPSSQNQRPDNAPAESSSVSDPRAQDSNPVQESADSTQSTSEPAPARNAKDPSRTSPSALPFADEPVSFKPKSAQSTSSDQSQQPAPAQTEKASTSESESSKTASRDRAPRQSAPWTENEFPPVFVSDQAPSTASTQFEKPPAQQEPAYTDLRPTDVPTSPSSQNQRPKNAPAESSSVSDAAPREQDSNPVQESADSTQSTSEPAPARNAKAPSRTSPSALPFADEPVSSKPKSAQSTSSAQSQQPTPAQTEKASTSESESSKTASRDRAPRQSAPWTENEFPPVFVSDQAPSTASTQFEKPTAQQEPAYTDLRPTDVPPSPSSQDRQSNIAPAESSGFSGIAQGAERSQAVQPSAISPQSTENTSAPDSEYSSAASRDFVPHHSAPSTEREVPVFLSDQAPSTASTQFEKPIEPQEPVSTDLRSSDVPTPSSSENQQPDTASIESSSFTSTAPTAERSNAVQSDAGSAQNMFERAPAPDAITASNPSSPSAVPSELPSDVEPENTVFWPIGQSNAPETQTTSSASATESWPAPVQASAEAPATERPDEPSAIANPAPEFPFPTDADNTVFSKDPASPGEVRDEKANVADTPPVLESVEGGPAVCDNTSSPSNSTSESQSVPARNDTPAPGGVGLTSAQVIDRIAQQFTQRMNSTADSAKVRNEKENLVDTPAATSKQPFVPPLLKSINREPVIRDNSSSTPIRLSAPQSAPPQSAPAQSAPAQNDMPAAAITGLTPEQVFQKIVEEVTVLVFGEDNAGPLNRRLIRMSLERRNIDGLLRELTKK